MPQTSMQLPTETRRQIDFLAHRWGLPETRNITPTIVQAIERVYQQEVRYSQEERDMLNFLTAELSRDLLDFEMVATENDVLRTAIRRMAQAYNYTPEWQIGIDDQD